MSQGLARKSLLHCVRDLVSELENAGQDTSDWFGVLKLRFHIRLKSIELGFDLLKVRRTRCRLSEIMGMAWLESGKNVLNWDFWQTFAPQKIRFAD